MEDRLLNILNQVLANKRHAPISALNPDARLRQDIGFDSFDLAELTVRLDEAFAVDVFEDGVVNTLGEIMAKLRRKS